MIFKIFLTFSLGYFDIYLINCLNIFLVKNRVIIKIKATIKVLLIFVLNFLAKF